MVVMRKTRAALAAAAATAIVTPAIAAAAITEVGTIPGESAMPDPACPAKPCLAISRTTGYQAKVGDVRGTHVVPVDGRIVAWSIKLSRPGKSQVEFFEKNLGGESTAQLTVLRPGNKLYARVLAQGNPVELQPFFGQTAQFALTRSIRVRKGQVIGLSVPTWAPALVINQPGTSSWRASRSKGGCNDFAKPTAQTRTGNVTRFFCLYRTARLTYTATLVPDAQPTGATRSVVVGG